MSSEHLEKQPVSACCAMHLKSPTKRSFVTTPKFETGQAETCAAMNLSAIASLWSRKISVRFDRATVKTIDRATLLAVLSKPGVSVPVCTPRSL